MYISASKNSRYWRRKKRPVIGISRFNYIAVSVIIKGFASLLETY